MERPSGLFFFAQIKDFTKFSLLIFLWPENNRRLFIEVINEKKTA